MKIIKASAGSGKTYRLAYEYIASLILSPERYSSVLAVTFTNKATDEMKRRILSELSQLATSSSHPYMQQLKAELLLPEAEVQKRAEHALRLILHDYSRFSVMTIDKFFQKILRSFIKELGLESDYTIDFNRDYLLQLAVDSLVDTNSSNKRVIEALANLVSEKLLEGRSFLFKRDLTSYGEAIFLDSFSLSDFVAKRENLTIFLSSIEEALTTLKELFVLKGSEAVAEIEASGHTVSDFYYGSNGFITYFYKCRNKEIAPYSKRVQSAIMEDANWGKAIESGLILSLKPRLAELCAMYDQHARFITSATIALKHHRSYLLLGDIATELDAVCSAKNIMLLSTSNRLLTGLTAGNDAPFIYEKCGTTFDTFLIDEFQDTSLEQWRNFAPLINNALAEAAPTRSAVTIVGDTKQSIYRWRGGDWRLIDGALKADIDHPQQIKVEQLRTNYRSHKNIIAFNNSLMRKVVSLYSNSFEEMISTQKEQGFISTDQYQTISPLLNSAYSDMEQTYAPKNASTEGFIKLQRTSFKDEQNLQLMCKAIEELQDAGYRASDIAILVKRKIEAKQVAAYLLNYKQSFPDKAQRYCYDVISSEALWVGGSEVVRFIVACLSMASSTTPTTDRLALAQYNIFLRREASALLSTEENLFIAHLRTVALEEAFEHVCSCHHLGDRLGDTAYLQAFHNVIINFTKKNIADIPSFISMWDKECDNTYIALPEGQNAITIQTIHSSKGLQYKNVVIPFLEWQTTPKSTHGKHQTSPTLVSATGNQEPFTIMDNTLVGWSSALINSHFCYTFCREYILTAIESINVLYVALTRAEHNLYLMTSDAPYSNGIAKLIDEAISIDESKATIINNNQCPFQNSISGTLCEDGAIVFGLLTPVASSAATHSTEHEVLCQGYPSFDYTGRIKLRLSHSRYSTPTSSLSPRSQGVLLHKLFEQARSREDIANKLSQMCFDGTLESSYKEEMMQSIDKALENPYIKQLFDTKNTIYNEHNILLPNQGEIVRPDRVVVNGTWARALDYKFGALESKSYHRQMQDYLKTLSSMGYTNVEGYVWYVLSGEVEVVKYSEGLLF